MLYPFLLMATIMQGQFKAAAIVDNHPTTYNQAQNEDVPITLPTNKYQCIRKAVEADEDSMTVMIACKKGPEPVFVLGAQCSLEHPDVQESVVALNIGTAAQPRNVVLTVACRTTVDPKKGTVL